MANPRKLGGVLCAILVLLALVSTLVLNALPSESGSEAPVIPWMSDSGAPGPDELTDIAPPAERPPEAKVGQPYTVQGYEVTVNGIRVGKERGSLPLTSVEDMHPGRDERIQVDSHGTFLDEHLYVDVDLTITNISHAEDEKFLVTACCLYANAANGIWPGAEIVASDFADLQAPGHEAGKVPLSVGESISGHVGFAVTEAALSDEDAPLFFAVDVTGALSVAPQEAGAPWLPVPKDWS